MQATLTQITFVFIVFNMVITLISVAKSYIRAKRSATSKNKLSEDFLNIKIALINAGREFLEKTIGLSVLALLLYSLSDFQVFQISWSLPAFILCFLLADFTYFMTHFMNHKMQIFWSQHCVHHSSDEFSLSTGYRNSWFGFLFNWVFYIPLAFIGFNPEMVLISVALIPCYAHILHTGRIRSIPYLEYILNTPKAHRIHHSSHEAHLDKNMGGVFMFWDQLFGTFTLKQEDKVVFGLTKPLEKRTVWFINLQEWIWIKNIFQQKGIKEALKAMFRSPENNKDLRAEIP